MESLYTLYIFSDLNKHYEQLDIEPIDLTNIFSLENMQDITKRKDSITKDLTLKGTHNNNRVLGHLYNLSRYSSDNYFKDLQHNFKANRQVKCILWENNVELVNGSLLIKNINVNPNNRNIEYQCQIVGNTVTFFSELKERKLTELDSLSLNILYNITNIKNSWTTPNLNYLFPTLDYGKDERVSEGDVQPNYWDNSFSIKNYRPAIYVKAYIDALFRGFRFDEDKNKYTQFDANNQLLNKYTYSSTLINSPSFKKLFIPDGEENFTKPFNGVWAVATASADSTSVADFLTGTNNFPFYTNYNLSTNNYLKVEKRKIKYSTRFISLDREIATIVPLEANLKTSLTFTITLTIRRPEGSGTLAMKGDYLIGLVDISKEETFTSSTNFIASETFTLTSSADNQTKTVTVSGDDLNLTGQYVIGIYKKSGETTTLPIISVSETQIYFGKTNTVSILDVALGETFNLIDRIPKNISIFDFLKNIMNMFNLYMVTDPNNPSNFIIETYNSFYQDTISLKRSKALDWTDKIDYSTYKLSTNHDLAKAYKFRYTEDTDMLNEFYKKQTNSNYGELTVNDRYGIKDTKEIELLFAPTINLSHSQNDKELPVLYKSDFLKGQKTTLSTKPRILFNNGVRNCEPYNIHYRGNTVVSTDNKYLHSSMFELADASKEMINSILFGLPSQYYLFSQNVTDDNSITLYEQYHQKQIMNLIDENIMIIEFQAFLNEMDISNLDFRIPIYIQTPYGNSYFKLLEVEYTNNKYPSTVKAMKIVTPLP